MFRDQLLPVLQDPVVESRVQLQFTELFDSLHDDKSAARYLVRILQDLMSWSGWCIQPCSVNQLYRKLVSSVSDCVDPYLQTSCCLCNKILLWNHMPSYYLLKYSSLILIFDCLCTVLLNAASSCSYSARLYLLVRAMQVHLKDIQGS